MSHPEFDLVDKFSMMDIIILEKMSLETQNENIFDFQASIQEVDNIKVINIVSDENSKLLNIND